MPVSDLLPEITLLLGAVAAILLATFSSARGQSLAAMAALLALAIAFGFALRQWGEAPRLTFSGVWALDGAAVGAKLIVLAAGAGCVLLAPQWLRGDRRHGEYYALLLFSVLGVLMMASASDSMELLVGVLLSSAASYPLAAFHRNWPPALEAGMKYFLIGALTNALLCIGVVLLFGLTGQTGYPDIALALALGADPLALLVAIGCIVLGLCFKLGAYPAHAWMPDVAQGAPAPAAALLTVLPKIGAAVALARLLALFPANTELAPLVAALAAVTMTLGNLAALLQQDLRRLLGWSAVAQSGYALMAVAAVGASPRAGGALLVFLASYAVGQLAAFAVVIHLRGRTALEDYAGLARQRPWAATVLVLALLSLGGIPPTVGFFGKWLLFQATLDAGLAWLALLALLNTVASLFYYLKVAGVMLFRPSDGMAQVLPGHAVGGLMLLAGALVLLAGVGAGGLWQLGQGLSFAI